jgi:hypothetical protein
VQLLVYKVEQPGFKRAEERMLKKKKKVQAWGKKTLRAIKLKIS